MKRIIYILILIGSFAFNLEVRASDKWEFVYPYPTNQILRDIKIISENELIAVGDNGTIIQSNDLGKTWDAINYFTTNLFTNFSSIDLLNKEFGFISYENSIFKYNHKLKKIEFTEFNFFKKINKTYIHTDKIIFIIGNNGKLFRSYNGGIDWVEYDKNLDYLNNNFTNIKFFDNENGVLLTNNNLILRTDNSGLSWTNIEIPLSIKKDTSNLVDIIFNSNNEWVLIDEIGNVFKTFDNGVSFNLIEIVKFDIDEKCIGINYFKENNVIFYQIITNFGIYKTSDFKKLDKLFKDINLTFTSFDINENIIILVGENGTICISEDFGKKWFLNSNKNSYTINTPFTKFVDDQNGFMFELTGDRIFKTTNRGKIWQFYKSFEGQKIKDVKFFTSKNCFILFVNGEVMMSMDSCKSWNILDIRLNGILAEIKQLNNNIGMFFSNEYQYWTFDSGETWSIDSINYQYKLSPNKTIVLKELFDFMFIKPDLWQKLIFTSKEFNEPALFLLSIDSGKTWIQKKQSFIPNDKPKIFIVDDSLYFCLYPDYVLEFRNDVSKKLLYSNANEDMLFINHNTGYMIGGNNIYKTSNRGITWLKLFSPYNKSFSNLHLFKDGELYITGSNATTLKNTKQYTSVEDLHNFQNLISNSLIFPNPSSDKITLDLGDLAVADLVFYDILGDEIMSIPNYTNKSEIDISSLSIGTYTIQIQTLTGSISQRLLVNR